MSAPAQGGGGTKASPPDDPRVKILEAYARAFETLSSDSLAVFDPLITDDIAFQDPFNSLRGRSDFVAVFAKMYRQLKEPRFTVLDTALGQHGYIRWAMTWSRKNGSTAAPVEGVTELSFAPDGRVCGHFDHWDVASQLYERAPILGLPLRILRQRFAL